MCSVVLPLQFQFLIHLGQVGYLLGNQDTGGSNNPVVIQGINGQLSFEEEITGAEEEIMILICFRLWKCCYW